MTYTYFTEDDLSFETLYVNSVCMMYNSHEKSCSLIFLNK